MEPAASSNSTESPSLLSSTASSIASMWQPLSAAVGPGLALTAAQLMGLGTPSPSGGRPVADFAAGFTWGLLRRAITHLVWLLVVHSAVQSLLLDPLKTSTLAVRSFACHKTRLLCVAETMPISADAEQAASSVSQAWTQQAKETSTVSKLLIRISEEKTKRSLSDHASAFTRTARSIVELAHPEGRRVVTLTRDASKAVLLTREHIIELGMDGVHLVSFFISEYKSLNATVERYQKAPTLEAWGLVVRAVSVTATRFEHRIDRILPTVEAIRDVAAAAETATIHLDDVLTDDIYTPLTVQLRANGQFCLLYSSSCRQTQKDVASVAHGLDVVDVVIKDVREVAGLLGGIRKGMINLRDELLNRKSSDHIIPLPMFDTLRTAITGLMDLDDDVHAVLTHREPLSLSVST